MNIELILGLAVLIFLFLFGAPIFVAFGLGAGLLTFFVFHVPLTVLSNLGVGAIDKYTLLAIPLFILAGYVMAYTGASKSLLDFFQSFIGHLPGGLPIVGILACTAFGTVSGSSIATALAVGTILLPTLIEAGYDKKFSAGVLTVSGVIGNLIPPSIGLIVIGSLTEVSISRLFLGGVFSGLLMTLLFSFTALIICIPRRRLIALPKAATWGTRWSSFVKSLPAWGMGVVILGGIYSGVFTPTEAAGVATVYALLVGVFVYRQLNWKNMKKILISSSRSTGTLLMIMAMAIFLSGTFNYLKIPQTVTNWAIAQNMTLNTFILMSTLVLLVLGFFIEGGPLIFITVPVFYPIMKELGGDLIHFGIYVQTAILVGQLTPPVAVLLYAGASMSNLPVNDVIKGAWPFMVAMLVGLVLIDLFPQISVFLPNLLGG